MSSHRLGIRPMELADFEVRVAYLHQATDEHLDTLGVDRSRLPQPDAWRASFEQNLALAAERPAWGPSLSA